MRVLCGLAVVFMSSFCWAADYSLPDDPQAPVIELDYQGGQIQRQSDAPHLQILADGTVKISSPYGIRKPVESKISPEGLQALLRFILVDQVFEEFDGAAVAQQVRAAQAAKGQLFAVADASTTVVRVYIDGELKEEKYYALQLATRQHPEIQALQQFQAIEKRLARGMHVIYAGGTQQLQAELAIINEALKAKAPEEAPLSAVDLSYAVRNMDDSVMLRFSRETPLPTGERRSVSAVLNQKPDEEPNIVVNTFTIPKQ